MILIVFDFNFVVNYFFNIGNLFLFIMEFWFFCYLSLFLIILVVINDEVKKLFVML